MVPAVGMGNMFNTMVKFPELAKEAKLLARGEKVNNPLLKELDELWGNIGSDQYKFVTPIGETGRDHAIYSNADMSSAYRIVSTMENVQQRITFFNALLAAQQRGATESILRKASKYIQNGMNDKALDDMGITKDLREALKNETDVFVYDKSGNLVEFNPMRAKNAYAVSAFNQGIRRGVGQIFQETFIGETGAWVHNDVWRLMAMFRGYVIGSIQKQLARSVDVHGPWATAGYMVGAMTFALPIMYAKAMVQSTGMSPEKREKFLEKRLSPDKLAFTSLSYTSTGGFLTEVMSFPLAALGSDLSSMRMGGGSSISQLLPVLGLAETAYNSIGDIKGRVNADGERVHSFNNIRRLMPLSNTPYTMSIMNLATSKDDDE